MSHVPDDLRELYEDAMGDDSRCSRTTTSGFMCELIERLGQAEQERDALKAQVANLTEPVSERSKKLWHKEWRPIINAIGEILVQEAMDAIERTL